MARRKRQFLSAEEPQKQAAPSLPVWETAIYARLSVENSKKKDDGDSIEGQIEICRDYVAEHPYLHLADTYVDNGWTGTNTDRPEFKRLLADIQEGRIKALVIKDFSRFSRDYIEAGNLLENIFPAMGVRFISVVDRYDSFETDGSASSLLIPLKNLINSFYSRDQSKKVSLAVHAKQLAGEHIPSMIPYGYRKSTTQKYRFEPDPETAPVVKEIFAMFLAGKGARPIVRELNSRSIPSPGKLRYLRGQTKRQCYSDCLWSQQVIKQILMNPTYMGDLVFGRMPTALYLGKPDYYSERDESKWRILPDMHEALISRADFYRVREMLEEGRREYQKTLDAGKAYRDAHPQLFKSGIVRCGCCGSNLGYSRMRRTGQGRYSCRNKQYGRCDNPAGIVEDKLAPVVWNAIQMQLALYADFEAVTRRIRDEGIQTERQQELQKRMDNIAAKLSACQKKREHLYDDYVDGILSAVDYMELKSRFDAEYQGHSSELNQVSVELARLNRSLSAENKWMQNIRNIRKSRKLTPEIAAALLDHINVFHDGYAQYRVEIVFRYQEERDALETAWRELIGGDKP
jgi:DNA invertase Pin-like site-specific DNA recombinase